MNKKIFLSLLLTSLNFISGMATTTPNEMVKKEYTDGEKTEIKALTGLTFDKKLTLQQVIDSAKSIKDSDIDNAHKILAYCKSAIVRAIVIDHIGQWPWHRNPGLLKLKDEVDKAMIYCDPTPAWKKNAIACAKYTGCVGIGILLCYASQGYLPKLQEGQTSHGLYQYGKAPLCLIKDCTLAVKDSIFSVGSTLYSFIPSKTTAAKAVVTGAQTAATGAQSAADGIKYVADDIASSAIKTTATTVTAVATGAQTAASNMQSQ